MLFVAWQMTSKEVNSNKIILKKEFDLWKWRLARELQLSLIINCLSSSKLSNGILSRFAKYYFLAMKLYCIFPHILCQILLSALSLGSCGKLWQSSVIRLFKGSKIKEKIILFCFGYHNPCWSPAEEIKHFKFSLATLQWDYVVLYQRK